jgi:hypothetical protein
VSPSPTPSGLLEGAVGGGGTGDSNAW